MRLLWLTLADPAPPSNGQFLYSDGLIRAVAATGCQVTVVGLARLDQPPRPARDGNVEWRLAREPARPAWASLLSLLPQISLRCRTAGMVEHLRAALAQRHWDSIVFDSIAPGWALNRVCAAGGSCRPSLVYLSHNHEEGVAHHMAVNARGWRRLPRRIEAWRVRRLERALLDKVDLVTANTPEDRATFAAAAPDKPVLCLPPGFDGIRIVDRVLDADLPRRAIIVGSFDWPPKRVSLEAFLEAAVPVLAAAGIELQVVGSAEASYLSALRQRFPGVDFTGPVPDVRAYMARARLALVPDLLGGFKLKALDYVFNRLPILAMRIAVPGMALRDRQDIQLFDSHGELARGVVGAIDDLPRLNDQQQRAFAACNERFDWRVLGRDLVDSIARVGHRRRSDSLSAIAHAATGAG